MPTLRRRSSKAERQAKARSEALESDKMVKTHDDLFFGGKNDCDMFVLPEKQTNFLMNMKFVLKKMHVLPEVVLIKTKSSCPSLGIFFVTFHNGHSPRSNATSDQE